MESIDSIEMNAQARQRWLRLEQGLPTEPVAGYTVVRQSDFEKSKVWRAVFIAAAIVVGITLFQPAAIDAPSPTAPPRTTA
ncbi:hypothetical protein [Paraburkholderia aspalathi]|uniref:hypothetical protein n=1 Tax=Paraburkholderia aspalathi TaxID=1324617 RepID=UPI003C9556B1